MKSVNTQDEGDLLFALSEIAAAKPPKGQRCQTCQHCRVWEYASNIFYCSITVSNRTQNGMAKTKARAWCKLWEAKP